MRLATLFAALVCFSLLTGFTEEIVSTATATRDNSLQPLDERKAQEALPQSHDSIWDMLAKTPVHLDEKSGTYTAKIPDEIRALAGKPVTITGFMLPLESEEKFTHFLLSKRTPTCFFCPPGTPDEIVEVFADAPTAWDEGMSSYTGTFTLTENKELGIFFQLKGAHKNKPPQ